MKTQTLIMVLAAVVFSTGCSTFKPQLPKMSSLLGSSESKTASKDDEPQLNYGTPERMLAVWKDSVRKTPGQKAMRGFGGRIYLYDGDGAAIRAAGELVVYGFDDSNEDREGSKADQKIVLNNDMFQKRYSPSALGDSYSVWIDWDEIGGPEKSVTLIPFFRTPDGKIVKAGQAISTLQSSNKNLSKEKLVSHEENAFDKDPDDVSHANFLQTDGDKNNVALARGIEQLPRKSSVRTTTIRLPNETQKRLRNSDFGISSNKESAKTTRAKSIRESSTREERPSRIEEARRKRREEKGTGNAFGMPGQL